MRASKLTPFRARPHSLVLLLVPLFLAGIALLGVSTLAQAGPAKAPTAVREVAPGGTDSGDCIGSPCATVGYAIGQAADGDTISVAAGTYTDTFTVGKNVIISGAGMTNTIIQAAASPGTASSRVLTVTTGVTVTIQNVTIRHGNTNSTSPVTGWGGGIYVSGTLTLENAAVISNTGNLAGGGIYNAGGLIVRNSLIGANSTGFNGAGIYNAISATVQIADSTLDANTGARGGGIYNRGAVTITRSTLSNNSASLDGGGIYNSVNATASILNTTISSNLVNDSNNGNDGGGVYNAGDMQLVHSTVARNHAFAAGGIFDLGGSGSITIKNTIILSNTDVYTPTPSADCLTLGTLTGFGRNLVGAGTGCSPSGGTTLTSTTPTLDLDLNLADNGGPNLTHALPPGSQAIDAAPDCTDLAHNAILTDQRGLWRPQGANCDIGAFETSNGLFDLTVSKRDSRDLVGVGQMFAYTLTITNTGIAEAPDVILTDTLPAEVSWQSDTCSAGPPAGNLLVWNVGALAPGTVSCVLTVTLDSMGSGLITNTVQVSTSSTEISLSNNSAQETTAVNQPPSISGVAITSPVNENDTAQLSGNLSDPEGGAFQLTVDWGDGSVTTYTYPAGTTVFTETHQYLDDNPTGTASDVYTVSLTVQDDFGAQGTAATAITVNNLAPIVDAGPDQAALPLSPVSFSALVTDTGSLDTYTALWDFGDGVTTTGTLTPTHVYASDGTYTVTLTVTDDDTGTGVDTLIVTVGPLADLSLSMVDSADPIGQGETLVYTLTVSNAGPSTASSVTLTDTLPGGVTFLSASAACTESSGVVVCALGSLTNGASTVVSLTVQVDITGTLTNTAMVSAALPDSDLSNNTASETTTAVLARFEIFLPIVLRP